MAKEKNVKKANYEDNEISKLIKLIVIVTIIFLAFYAITYFVNKKDEPQEETSTSTIQYDEILIGNLLTQPNDEYYVMIYDDNDYNSKVYEMYLSMYEDKEDAIRYYTADLTNPLNSSFVSDESNFEIEDISDLKVSTSVLLKIKDKKIESVYVGDKLKQHLEDISKTEEE